MCAVSCKCCGTCRYVRGYTPCVHGISPRCTYVGADVRSERHDSGTGAHLFHGTEQNRAYQSSEYNILYGTEYVPMPNLDRRTICQTQYTKRMRAEQSTTTSNQNFFCLTGRREHGREAGAASTKGQIDLCLVVLPSAIVEQAHLLLS